MKKSKQQKAKELGKVDKKLAELEKEVHTCMRYLKTLDDTTATSGTIKKWKKELENATNDKVAKRKKKLIEGLEFTLNRVTTNPLVGYPTTDKVYGRITAPALTNYWQKNFAIQIDV